MERLEVKNLNHHFGLTEILQNINFNLNKGQVLSIVGPSGGGKTTLMHLCADLLDVEEGSVENSFISSSFAFQEARLLPWKNVIDNISLGLLAKGESKKEAILKSKEGLNKMLNAHGLRIIDVSTPKPHFDPIYEKTIETRINADQEVAKQDSKRKKLLSEKKFRVNKIKNDKEIEFRTIEGELKRKVIDIEKQFIMVKKNAETYKIEQTGIGEAKKLELTTMAKARTEQFKMDAEALSSKIKAMEEQGDAVVYKILAEKYKNMNIQFQPYSTDSTPEHIKVESISATQK